MKGGGEVARRSVIWYKRPIFQKNKIFKKRKKEKNKKTKIPKIEK